MKRSGLLHRAKQWARGFGNAQTGATSTVFALAVPSILAVVAGATDYATLTNQRSHVRNAAESSALSVARQMTMSRLSDEQIKAIAGQFAQANLLGNGIEAGQVDATLSPDRLAVKVTVTSPPKSALGFVAKVAGITEISSDATARVGQQTKLCLLSVSQASSNEVQTKLFVSKEPTGIEIQRDARLIAPGCLLHTNMATREAFTVATGAKVTADVLCAVGGIKNNGGTVEAAVVDTCPKVTNPMDSRYYPGVGQNCDGKTYKDIIYETGIHTLNPGNFCGNITISGEAKVRLSPGTYAIQGALVVKGNAELVGVGVGIYLWGGRASSRQAAKFAFLENALIDLSAPQTGPMAGILLWEGVNGAAFDQANLTASANYHQINSLRARRLTGTIYLPGGRLLIDAPGKVAEDSDYTVLVVNRLDLSDGPNLVLNSNYAKSNVPVPLGLGPIGAKNVRLVNGMN